MTENPGSRNPLLKGRGAVTCAAPPRGRDQPRRRSSQNSTNTTNNNTLHPGAWWLWSLGLATAATRTTNPLLLTLLITVTAYVVATHRTTAPWSRSYTAFAKLALAVLVIRLLFATILGSPIPGTHPLLTLPELPLPTGPRASASAAR